MDSKKDWLVRFNYTAVIVAVMLVLLALIAFWIAAVQTAALWQSVWSNIGSALATIGLLGVLYDSLLRPRLIADLVQSRNLQQSGIRTLGKASELGDWSKRAYTGDVVMVIPDLPGWLDQGDWQELLGRASTSNTQITIYTHIDDDATIEATTSRIRADWESPQAGKRPSEKKSGLVVYQQSQASGLMMYKGGDSAWISIDAPFVPFVPGKAMGMYVERTRSAVWDWVESIEARIAVGATNVTVAGDPDTVQAIVRRVPAQSASVMGEKS